MSGTGSSWANTLRRALAGRALSKRLVRGDVVIPNSLKQCGYCNLVRPTRAVCALLHPVPAMRLPAPFERKAVTTGETTYVR